MQVVGGFTSLLGVFILALPVPLILNTYRDRFLTNVCFNSEMFRFIVNYRNRVWKQEVKLKKCERSSQEAEVGPAAVSEPGHSRGCEVSH